MPRPILYKLFSLILCAVAFIDRRLDKAVGQCLQQETNNVGFHASMYDDTSAV